MKGYKKLILIWLLGIMMVTMVDLKTIRNPEEIIEEDSTTTTGEITTPISTTMNTTSTSTTLTPTQRPNYCPPCTNDLCFPSNSTTRPNNVPFPGNCTRYCACSAMGVEPTLMECPSGLYYNIGKQVCDWPSATACVTEVPGC